MSRYRTIAEHLATKIRGGEFAHGAKLPAETALAKHYQVSLPTIRQALSVLRALDLIYSDHGRGTFVQSPPVAVHITHRVECAECGVLIESASLVEAERLRDTHPGEAHPHPKG